MRRLLLAFALLALPVSACQQVPSTTSPAPISATVPGGTAVCSVLDPTKLDIALRAYDAALDAINLLIDAKVLVPGSARAKAVASANDRVLAGFTAAEAARQACNATSYTAALNSAAAAIADVRTAIRSN